MQKPTKEQLQDFAQFMLNKMQSPSPDFLTSLIGDYLVPAPIILTTHDGVKITNPDQWLFGLSNGNIKVSEIADYAKPDIKWFSTKEACAEYQAANMRLFSLQDLYDMEKQHGGKPTSQILLSVGMVKALALNRVNG